MRLLGICVITISVVGFVRPPSAVAGFTVGFGSRSSSSVQRDLLTRRSKCLLKHLQPLLTSCKTSWGLHRYTLTVGMCLGVDTTWRYDLGRRPLNFPSSCICDRKVLLQLRGIFTPKYLELHSTKHGKWYQNSTSLFSSP